MSLLSLSPLLSSLFVSYANRAAALESTSATPSPDSEEWKALQATITALREENERLRSEACEMAEKLGAANASQEAFRSQVSSLKEVNVIQQVNIKSLQAESFDAKEKYDRLVVDSNTQKSALQIHVLDLEARRGELKETVVEQQIKISKLERRMPGDNLPAPRPGSPPRGWSVCTTSIPGSPLYTPSISGSPVTPLQTLPPTVPSSYGRDVFIPVPPPLSRAESYWAPVGPREADV